MRELSISKRISLSKVGEGWDKCYMDIRPFSYEDLQDIGKLDDDTKSAQILFDLLGKRFISGKVVVNNQVVDMEADDIRALPFEVINQVVKEATGNLTQEQSQK